MFTDLLNSSYFALFLIVALGFMLGRIKIKGLSLDVSAVIFIALLFGHFGVIIPKELGNFGLVLFIRIFCPTDNGSITDSVDIFPVRQ